MTARNKARGNAFERFLVQKAQDKGLPAKRAWGSDGRSMGLSEKVDLTIGDIKVQAKKRKTIPKYLELEDGFDIVVFNSDRKPAKVLMYFDDFLDMIKKSFST